MFIEANAAHRVGYQALSAGMLAFGQVRMRLVVFDVTGFVDCCDVCGLSAVGYVVSVSVAGLGACVSAR